MELALSLGDNKQTPSSVSEKESKISFSSKQDLGFCMGLEVGFLGKSSEEEKSVEVETVGDFNNGSHEKISVSSSDPPLQLDLLPLSPVPRTQLSHRIRFPSLAENFANEPGLLEGRRRRLDVKRLPAAEETEGVAARLSASPPNSAPSSFQLDLGISSTGNGKDKRDGAVEAERTGSRASDDDETGSTRKKLRLSKQQSAFLEESFKEHNALSPKQKLALARQLNLRPRQIEVWFQNRRARTKLKQTEVDYEYLKTCCETLTEENRRLQKELQELRALKASRSFCMQLPATTLTMCPSCERVSTANSSAPLAPPTPPLPPLLAAALPLGSSGSNNDENSR